MEHGAISRWGAPRLPSYRLVFRRELWERLFVYMLACPQEINGFGYINWQDTGTDIKVTDIVILDQEVTMSSADNEVTAIGAHVTSMFREGLDPRIMRLQWHSHVNGEAYFSPTDLDNIEERGQNAEFLISLVGNKRGDFQVRLDVFQPFRYVLPLEVVVTSAVDPALYRQVAADIRRHVRTRNPYGRLTRLRLPSRPPEVTSTGTVHRLEGS